MREVLLRRDQQGFSDKKYGDEYSYVSKDDGKRSKRSPITIPYRLFLMILLIYLT